MKCIVPSQNAKIVARAIHSLSKIGDELYIEPSINDLVFCTISSAQSALCEFRMCKSFFSSFNFTVEDTDIKCKLAMKSCLGVFKNPHCADKQVESCEIRFKAEGTVVIFYIKYANSSTKKFFLPIIDSEKVEVNYEKDAPNRIMASSKLLASSFKNFRSNEDEITVKLAGDKVVIKNHLEPGRDKGLMRTELSFQPSDFECCTINSPTAVTFTLKEMRAAINFAEPANLPININITKPGEPLVLKVAYHPAYESTYVIATLRASRMDLESSNNVTQGSSMPSRQSARQPQPVRTVVANVTVSEPGPNISRSKSRDEQPEPELNMSLHNDFQDQPLENINDLHVSTIANKSLHNAPVPSTSFKNFNSKSFVNHDQPMEIEENIANKNFDLITSVFQRCFIQKILFESLPGHDVVLCQTSDSE